MIESELKTANVDMKPVFFAALNKDGIINESDLSSESLGRVLGPLQAQVTDSLNRQEQMIRDIQQNHQQFTQVSS